MRKTTKKETLNLILSAILIAGYVVCTYFFLTLSKANAPAIAPYIFIAVFVVFGLIVFYATRIGDGIQVKRFSLCTLFLLDLPALYCILACAIKELPLHQQLSELGSLQNLEFNPILILACVALGYGLPYTFLSGYEEQTNANDSLDFCQDDCAQCCSCLETVVYTLCTAEDEGALLVVDDMDMEFDFEKEIHQSDAVLEDGVAQVGSYVKLSEAQAVCHCSCEALKEEEAEETTEEATEEEETSEE